MDVDDLRGRTALVSGASRGLGASVARHLAACGARVGVNYRSSADAADSVVDDIERAGGTAVALRGDVTTEAGAAAVVEGAIRALGSVDILVNNAVGPHNEAPLAETDVDAYESQLRFAVSAPVLLGRALLGELERSPSARIINIGSEIVQQPTGGFAAYTTAKAALIGLTRAWAVELGPMGVTVNLVAPGFVPVERHAGVPEAEVDQYVENVPLGRIGTPDDVAGVIAFLASDRAAFLTGQVLTANGGRTFG
jgi:3-oxoacyl-[acyl-carrier protein] reductase